MQFPSPPHTLPPERSSHPAPQNARRRAVVAIVAVTLGGLLFLRVHSASPAAAADASPAERVRQLLAQLAASEQRGQIEDPIARAKQALSRSEAKELPAEAKAALEAAAVTWATVGADWLETSRREAEANQVEQDAEELRAKVKHAQALLEETEARRGRAEGRLRQLPARQDTESADEATAPPKAEEAAP